MARGDSVRCLTIDECKQWRTDFSRRRGWKRQVTCVTPLKRLSWFTNVLLEHLLPFDIALLTIDQVVFDVPSELEFIRRTAGEPRPLIEVPGLLFENDHEGFRAALEAALSGWIDLRAVFAPSQRALRADHDEFTTFFSLSSGKIADLRNVFIKGDVSIVQYTRGPNPPLEPTAEKCGDSAASR